MATGAGSALQRGNSGRISGPLHRRYARIGNSRLQVYARTGRVTRHCTIPTSKNSSERKWVGRTRGDALPISMNRQTGMYLLCATGYAAPDHNEHDRSDNGTDHWYTFQCWLTDDMKMEEADDEENGKQANHDRT